MHIYFVGIGGTGIGPLALIAKQAGHQVSGSDKQDSQYISYLKKQGIENIFIGGNAGNIEELHKNNPIDWVVQSSAISIEDPTSQLYDFVNKNSIKLTKRDELLNHVIEQSGKKLIAIAGTHGKTTTTAMAVWLFKQLNLPISYSVGAKIPFGEMGYFDQDSEYFVYECDEFDYNFLAFQPYISLITGVDYDHHDIFPDRKSYQDAFQKFIDQSKRNIVWSQDAKDNAFQLKESDITLDDNDSLLNTLSIAGRVNRKNALQVMTCLSALTGNDISDLSKHMSGFPGISRRFEKIIEGLYTDYAHTAPKVAGCLQLASEVSDNVVVVYEPLTNRRQHFIKDEYKDLFKSVKKLYWVPSYLAREDPDQEILSPSHLIEYMDNKEIAEPAELNPALKEHIQKHLNQGDLVVCMSGGGGGSLDEWLRQEFKTV